MITKNIARLALVATGALLMCAPLSRAAEAEKPKQEGQQPPPGQEQRRNDPQATLQLMTKELGLTAEQKTKLKPILEQQWKEMQALRQDTSLSQEDRRTKYRELREKYAPKLKEILTPEQVAKWEKMQQEMRGRRQQRPQ